MRKVLFVLLVTIATLSSGCIASRKFVRTEVKTSSDALNARIDTTNSQVGELKDGVARVDGRVTAVDGRVSQLDTKTNERFEGVKTEVQAVDQKAAGAQSAAAGAKSTADQAVTGVTTLDEKFQNRNLYSVAQEKAILFKFDSAKLDPKYQTDLEDLSTALTQNPNAIILLEGRTDAKGDPDYNVKLGERRVDSVKRYLTVEKGIPVYRIHEISFGAAKPVAQNNSKEGREQNRAVVVQVLVPGKTGNGQNQN